ncbi:hypothetical protein D9757_010255 [Collybiopsis confluens]|uniref:Uncharacterized protein n=1 Tax=Collybiopsis confluens TaxID=2823264 RepID=A0A8H5HB10_9AGAR|nr:hypothetical protein D9757_010255 [Collybiopsis confluens]
MPPMSPLRTLIMARSPSLAISNSPSLVNPGTLSFKNVQSSPGLLTAYAAPNQGVCLEAYNEELSHQVSEIKHCLESLLANIIAGDVFLSKPNASILYRAPHLCHVRLCCNFHFGMDDPKLFPQPYDPELPHLCITPAPSTNRDHPYFFGWLAPEASDFYIVNTGRTEVESLGKLVSGLLSGLKKLHQTALERVPEATRDPILVDLKAKARLLLFLLDSVATLSVTFARTAYLQRLCLELVARSLWISNEWAVRMSDAKFGIRHPIEEVVGAFTENYQELDLLFHMGIPVWHVSEAKHAYGMRVDAVAPVISEDLQPKITQPGGFVVDCSDAEPPYLILFDGFARRPGRYQVMMAFLESQSASSLFSG